MRMFSIYKTIELGIPKIGDVFKYKNRDVQVLKVSNPGYFHVNSPLSVLVQVKRI